MKTKMVGALKFLGIFLIITIVLWTLDTSEVFGPGWKPLTASPGTQPKPVGVYLSTFASYSLMVDSNGVAWECFQDGKRSDCQWQTPSPYPDATFIPFSTRDECVRVLPWGARLRLGERSYSSCTDFAVKGEGVNYRVAIIEDDIHNFWVFYYGDTLSDLICFPVPFLVPLLITVIIMVLPKLVNFTEKYFFKSAKEPAPEPEESIQQGSEIQPQSKDKRLEQVINILRWVARLSGFPALAPSLAFFGLLLLGSFEYYPLAGLLYVLGFILGWLWELPGGILLVCAGIFFTVAEGFHSGLPWMIIFGGYIQGILFLITWALEKFGNARPFVHNKSN